MTDERGQPTGERRGAAGSPTRKRVRARTPAPTTVPERSRRDGQVRPWEVDTKAEREAARAARDPSSLLKDVPSDAVIVARRLTKEYGDFTAVERLDLTVRRGEVFGLLGPNGAGKTTTVLMILGLTEPTAGVVRVLGLDPTREPLAVKRRVGYLPDDVGFYPGMTGRQNLRYTAQLNGMSRREADARIDELLSEVRLQEAADRNVETYSRGMRQRLGIADALVKDPEVLILDEPTIAIDPSGVEELLALLRRLVREHRLTVLLSSHILGQVQSLCDRVGFFSRGRLIAAGPLADLSRGGPGLSSQFEVGVEEDPSAIGPALARVPGVVKVEDLPQHERLRLVHAPAGAAATLTTALAAANLHVVHLRRQGDDLLELYRRYVPEEHDGSAR